MTLTIRKAERKHTEKRQDTEASLFGLLLDLAQTEDQNGQRHRDRVHRKRAYRPQKNIVPNQPRCKQIRDTQNDQLHEHRNQKDKRNGKRDKRDVTASLLDVKFHMISSLKKDWNKRRTRRLFQAFLYS